MSGVGICICVAACVPSKYLTIKIYNSGFELIASRLSNSVKCEYKQVDKIIAPHVFENLNPGHTYPVNVFFNDGIKKLSIRIEGSSKFPLELMAAHRDYILGQDFPTNLWIRNMI